MTATYHISTDELDAEFLQNLRNTFGRKQLLITIEEDKDAALQLLSTLENRDKFKQSVKELENGDLVKLSLEDLRT